MAAVSPDGKIRSTGRKKRNKSSRKGGESWGKGGNRKSSEASIITGKRGCGLDREILVEGVRTLGSEIILHVEQGRAFDEHV